MRLILGNILTLTLLGTSNGKDAGHAAQVVLASQSEAESTKTRDHDGKTKFINNLIQNMTIPEMGESFVSSVLDFGALLVYRGYFNNI